METILQISAYFFKIFVDFTCLSRFVHSFVRLYEEWNTLAFKRYGGFILDRRTSCTRHV